MNHELAHIRDKFKASDKLSLYSRKKRVGLLRTLLSLRKHFVGMLPSCCISSCWATTLSLATWRCGLLLHVDSRTHDLKGCELDLFDALFGEAGWLHGYQCVAQRGTACCGSSWVSNAGE